MDGDGQDDDTGWRAYFLSSNAHANKHKPR